MNVTNEFSRINPKRENSSGHNLRMADKPLT